MAYPLVFLFQSRRGDPFALRLGCRNNPVWNRKFQPVPGPEIMKICELTQEQNPGRMTKSASRGQPDKTCKIRRQNPICLAILL